MFWTNLQNLLSAMFSTARYEVAALRRIIIFGVFNVLLIAFLQLITAGTAPNVLLLLGWILAILMAIKLFATYRFIRITITGEILELTGFVKNKPGVIDNKIIRTYLVMSLVFTIAVIFSSGVLGLLPLYESLTRGSWIVIITWPFLLLALVFILAAISRKLVWTLGILMFLTIFIYTIHLTWPSLQGKVESIDLPSISRTLPGGEKRDVLCQTERHPNSFWLEYSEPNLKGFYTVRLNEQTIPDLKDGDTVIFDNVYQSETRTLVFSEGSDSITVRRMGKFYFKVFGEMPTNLCAHIQ